ncbi:MAG: CpaF/VirB11 family protein [Marinilabiliaceae bacterium]|nr:CpaF/VirB11 family protein [Marinilabiliaceae bacterium]
MKQLEIKIDDPSSDFSKHLEDNDRILFSGGFGSGKTTFLKYFFNDETMKD